MPRDERDPPWVGEPPDYLEQIDEIECVKCGDVTLIELINHQTFVCNLCEEEDH